MSSSTHSQETTSQMRRQSVSSATSDDDEDFIDFDDVNNNHNSSNEYLTASGENSKTRNKKKKTLGRVKIEMTYISNKIRRYTTFSKRKTGIMKKAYELATLTGTEVMLLVASETGHVYTYATAKLQPMITSEAGKALIQTCLAKDEPIVEPVIDTSAATTLNNNDVIFVDENQRKKRTNTSVDSPIADASTGYRPIKRAKLKSSEDISSTHKTKQVDSFNSHAFLPAASVPLPQTTTVALPLSCFINPDFQKQQQPAHDGISPSFTVDLNTFKTNGMNIIFAPPSSVSSQPSPSSNIPIVLTFGNLPYSPT